MGVNGPEMEWRVIREALRGCGTNPVTIGTFAVASVLCDACGTQLTTDDIDFGFEPLGVDGLQRVSRTMASLGYRLVARTPGKWISAAKPGLEVDLLTPDVGDYPAYREVCRVQPWMDVMAISAQWWTRRAALRGRWSGGKGSPTPGPLAIILGKALKVDGYARRPEWPGNRRDVDHGAKSCYETGLLLTCCAQDDLVAEQQLLEDVFGDSARVGARSLARAVRAYLRWFGADNSPGYRMGQEWLDRSGIKPIEASHAGQALARRLVTGEWVLGHT